MERKINTVSIKGTNVRAQNQLIDAGFVHFFLLMLPLS
jgi:hypothetical protein